MGKKSYRLISGFLTAVLLVGTVGAVPAKAAVDFGWEEENGNWYWYENGVRQGYDPDNAAYRGKEIYDPGSDAWYWLDNVDQGKKAVSKDVYQESLAGNWAGESDGTGKWVRYDEKGHMIKGWNTNENGTYYFDPVYGTMAKGYAVIDGSLHYFDKATGVESPAGWDGINGWVVVENRDGNCYWYENGVRQGYDPDNAAYRGKEIYDPESDAWYWLDNVDQGKKAVSKDVYQESAAGDWAEGADGTGKWVRYDAQGHMIKGWRTNENGTYYFDPIYGTMAKGKVNIEGKEYEFDRETGILKGEADSEEDDTENDGNDDDAATERNIEWSVSDDGLLTVTGECGSDGLLWDGQGDYDSDNHYKAPWYEDRDNITSAYVNVKGAKNLSCLFFLCEKLEKVDLRHLDTSEVVDMQWMFYMCSGLESLDLSSFDTSNVTNMFAMFIGCSSLTGLDVSSFDTSNITNMGAMFKNCYSLTGLDVSSFDTSNVTIMAHMFNGCSSLTGLDLSNFDTLSVMSMSYMFNGCSSLTSLDLNSFDTSNVTSMFVMFNGCSSLTGLDLNSFDTSNVTNMAAMFNDCSSLTGLDLNSFDTSNVTDMGDMFKNCSSLTEILAGSGWKIGSETDTSLMFSNCGTDHVTQKK